VRQKKIKKIHSFFLNEKKENAVQKEKEGNERVERMLRELTKALSLSA
jgi:hypothetical protein